MKRRQPHRGFTLIELTVVLAILGVLAGLLLAAVQRVRESANRTMCSDHLRQLGLALQHYHDAHSVFPPGCSFRKGADPHPHMGWCARLLPFLEQERLWSDALRAYKEEKLFVHNPPHTGLSTVVPAFTCPSDGRTRTPVELGPMRVALASYLGVGGTDYVRKDGVLYLDSRVRLADVTDGASNTLIAGERPPSADRIFGWWYAGWGQSKDGSGDTVLGVLELNVSTYTTDCPAGPYAFSSGRVQDRCDLFHFWSLHPGGANFVFADGSAHFLRYSAAPLMPALATRSGGEPTTAPN